MRNVIMWGLLALVAGMLLVAFAAPVWASPALGITPTPTPTSPPPPAEIPEPITLALLGAGVAGLIGYTRARKG